MQAPICQIELLYSTTIQLKRNIAEYRIRSWSASQMIVDLIVLREYQVLLILKQ